jgi:hypothetical protein
VRFRAHVGSGDLAVGRRQFAQDLDGVVAGLAGADADGFVDRGDEDLAVADPAGLGRVLDRLDRLSSNSSASTTSTFTFGRKSTTYSAPRYSSVCPFCRPKPLASMTVIPEGRFPEALPSLRRA